MFLLSFMYSPASVSVSASHTFSGELKKIKITLFANLGDKKIVSFSFVFQLMAKYPVPVFHSS